MSLPDGFAGTVDVGHNVHGQVAGVPVAKVHVYGDASATPFTPAAFAEAV